MADWLYALPDAAIILGFALVLGGAVAGLPFAIGIFPVLRPSSENTDFILRIQSTLFTMTGFALAFTLVQAQGNFRRVEAIVQAEASQINTLDRMLTRYGDPSVAAIRPALLAYANSIVKEEWPKMANETGHDATLRAFVPVAREVTAIDAAPGRQTSLYSEMLKSLDVIAESRESRLDAAKIALPTVYWIVVWFAMCVLVVASGTVVRTPFRTLFLASQAAVLGAFIGVVFITDHPLKGQTSVGPDALNAVIAAIRQRSS